MANGRGGGGELPPPPLSGKALNSFAYLTIKDRLPVILTKVLDDLCRDRKRLIEEYGNDAGEEVSIIAGAISKLKYEMQTDKPLSVLSDYGDDVASWNDCLAQECARSHSTSNRPPRWFSSPWLFVECYMYRRIHSAFLSTTLLAGRDPFVDGKKKALASAKDSVVKLLRLKKTMVRKSKGEKIGVEGEEESKAPGAISLTDLKDFTRDLFLLCLWGNKCDLSISAGRDNASGQVDDFEALRQWDKNILVDDFEKVWKLLLSSNGRGEARGLIIDWVLDNAGFEFFTDMLLADYLTEMGFARQIRFHVKRIPWFVSDVTKADINSTIEWIKTLVNPDFDPIQNPEHRNENSDDNIIDSFYRSCRLRIRCSLTWSVEEHEFWTLPNAFRSGVGKGRDGAPVGSENNIEDRGRPGMLLAAPDLYATLTEPDVVIFKGDLNYRKLVGDLDWARTTPFAEALGDFRPTKVLVLRTLKADVVTGLEDGVAWKLDEECQDWMTNGQYAVIQMC